MVSDFSDDELAFLRHVRFGELPQRVRPDDYVETVETDAPMEELNTEPWQGLGPGHGG